MASVDPQRTKRLEAKAKSKKVLGRLGVADLELTEHEAVIAAEVPLVSFPTCASAQASIGHQPRRHHRQIRRCARAVACRLPAEHSADIGGLDPIIGQLREAIIFPLCYPQLFQSAAGLFGTPKGVLLYGPPGCGKTLLAKALARESSATFINVRTNPSHPGSSAEVRTDQSERPAEQVVRRGCPPRRRPILACTQAPAKHHLHRRDRLFHVRSRLPIPCHALTSTQARAGIVGSRGQQCQCVVY
jgi:hypothetical protein